MSIPKGTKERLAAYSDAIIAVVATLLVLGIAVPEDHKFSTDGLAAFLFKIRHDVGAYALSFLIINSYWLEHHVIFLFLHHCNRTFTWLNFVFLFFITLIPFATKLLSVYRHDTFVVLIYGMLQVACGLTLAVQWWYANHQHRLIPRPIPPAVMQSMTRRILAGPLINLAAVGMSLVSVPVALVMVLVVPLLNLSHLKVDRALRDQVAD